MVSDTKRIKFTADTTGRLDQVIQKHLAGTTDYIHITRAQVKLMIENGDVEVNGESYTKAGDKVRSGSKISVLFVQRKGHLEPFEMALDILYEDKSLLVVNKPSGLSMHPGAGISTGTLANAIVSHLGSKAKLERGGIVHCLDKDTTGLVVIAKSLASHNFLAKQFASRTIQRRYLALVFSTPRGSRSVVKNDEGTIDAPIARHPTRRTMMAVVAEGRKAVTHWRVLSRMEYGTLLELKLETGRTHQIRVHLSHIGSPVIGDLTYGDFSGLPRPLKTAAENFRRQALHAYRLGFVHPTSGEKIDLSARPPEDFLQLLTEFGGTIPEIVEKKFRASAV